MYWFISLVNNIIKTNINNSKSDKYSNQIHFQWHHFSDFKIRKFLKLRFHMWFCSHRIIKKWNEYSESQQNRHGSLIVTPDCHRLAPGINRRVRSHGRARVRGFIDVSTSEFVSKVMTVSSLLERLKSKSSHCCKGRRSNHFQPMNVGAFPETFSKSDFYDFGPLLKGFFENFFQNLRFQIKFEKLKIRVMTQESFRKLFPDIGKSFRKSFWVMTRFWKKIFFHG